MKQVVFIVSQTLAMGERLTQIITFLAVSASGLERIEAECEVSEVTKILLKVHHMLPSECPASDQFTPDTSLRAAPVSVRSPSSLMTLGCQC